MHPNSEIVIHPNICSHHCLEDHTGKPFRKFNMKLWKKYYETQKPGKIILKAPKKF